MKPLLLIIVGSMLMGTCFSQSNNKAGIAIQNIHGTWRTTAFIASSVAALDENEANKLLNNILYFGDSLAVVFNDTCYQVTYDIQKVKTIYYLYLLKMSPEKINIVSDSLWVFQTYCLGEVKYFNENSPEFDYTLLWNNEKVYIAYNGLFFQMQRDKKRKSIIRSSR